MGLSLISVAWEQYQGFTEAGISRFAVFVRQRNEKLELGQRCESDFSQNSCG